MRKLIDNDRVVVAAPEYLKIHGRPAIPEDLTHHECLLCGGGTQTHWRLLDSLGKQGRDSGCLAPSLRATANDVRGQAIVGGHYTGNVDSATANSPADSPRRAFHSVVSLQPRDYTRWRPIEVLGDLCESRAGIKLLKESLFFVGCPSLAGVDGPQPFGISRSCVLDFECPRGLIQGSNDVGAFEDGRRCKWLAGIRINALCKMLNDRQELSDFRCHGVILIAAVGTFQ